MNNIDCPVCYDDIPYNIINPCGHSLCDKCSVFEICPLCRCQIISYIPNRILKNLELENMVKKSESINMNYYNNLIETIEYVEKNFGGGVLQCKIIKLLDIIPKTTNFIDRQITKYLFDLASNSKHLIHKEESDDTFEPKTHEVLFNCSDHSHHAIDINIINKYSWI